MYIVFLPGSGLYSEQPCRPGEQGKPPRHDDTQELEAVCLHLRSRDVEEGSPMLGAITVDGLTTGHVENGGWERGRPSDPS